MRSVVMLATKDLRLLFRDRFSVFWMLAFPIVYAVFFGAIFGGGEERQASISVAVVDDAHTETSRGLVDRLAAHESLLIAHDAVDEPRVHSLDEARSAVRKGTNVAYVRIPDGYDASPFALFGGGDPKAPSLEIGIDPSRKAESGYLQGILMESVFGALGERFRDKQAMRTEIERTKRQLADAEDLDASQQLLLTAFMNALGVFLEGVDFGDAASAGGGFVADPRVTVVDVTRERGSRPKSAFEVTFPSAMLWGLMSVAIGFAMMIVRERTQGTLLRLRTAPISRTQLLAGKGLGCFAACVLVMAFLVVFARIVFGVRIGNPGLAALAIASTAACFTGLMMMVSVMGRTEQAVAGSSWGVMMPFAMLGGGMIPLIAMPGWLLALSDFSPFKWGIYAMEGAVWRGFDLVEMVLPCVILVLIGALSFVTGVVTFRRMDG